MLKMDFKKTPNPARPAKEVGSTGPIVAQLGIMKICMDFGPYYAFWSSDVPEMVNQQNSWNSLVISTYLLYLE
jgi:hypothetical protein